MESKIFDALCLAHHPRWIEISSAKGWVRAICSNCGEPVNFRTNKRKRTCQNCESNMEIERKEE